MKSIISDEQKRKLEYLSQAQDYFYFAINSHISKIYGGSNEHRDLRNCLDILISHKKQFFGPERDLVNFHRCKEIIIFRNMFCHQDMISISLAYRFIDTMVLVLEHIQGIEESISAQNLKKMKFKALCLYVQQEKQNLNKKDNNNESTSKQSNPPFQSLPIQNVKTQQNPKLNSIPINEHFPIVLESNQSNNKPMWKVPADPNLL